MLLAAVVLLAVIALTVAESLGTWRFEGGPLIALGSIAAMTGTYLCLMMLLLVARVPRVEQEIGQARLVALHRTVAPYAISLIALHVVLTTTGYAQEAERGPLAELWHLAAHEAWMLPALVAFVLMVALGALSYRRLRERLSYETWWAAHLYFYLAVALAFGHQVERGSMFAGRPVQRWFWIGLYVAVLGLIVGARFVLPAVRSLRHRLRVVEVVREGVDVVSIHIAGRHLDRLDARAGQYLQWRFLTRDWWWQAHPYSLSAAPTADRLRITVREVGDQTSSLARRLAPGARVWFEGPYGDFTADRSHGRSVVLVAAGIGAAPVRALLEELATCDDAEVDVVIRARSRESAPLQPEIEAIAAHRGWRVHLLTGPRSDVDLGPEALRRLVPRIAHADVYVCGPDSFVDDVLRHASRAGVPESRLHHESFRVFRAGRS